MSIRSAADCQIVRFLVRQDVNRAGVAAYLSAEDSPPHPPPSWGARSREMAAPGGEDETAAHGAIPSPSHPIAIPTARSCASSFLQQSSCFALAIGGVVF